MALLDQDGSDAAGLAVRRFKLGLQIGSIRSQAKSALLHFPNHVEKKYNWPIPAWVWQARTGQLVLEEDRYLIVFDDYAPPREVRSGPFFGVWKIELIHLKIHKAEMATHLEIDLMAPKPKVMNSSNAIRTCKTWLEGEFRKDPNQLLKKSDFQKGALSHFAGKLNPKGFRDAWRMAIASDPARAKGGRRPGT